MKMAAVHELAEDCDAIVVGVDDDGNLDPTGQQLDQKLSGWLGRVLNRETRSGKPIGAKLLAAPDAGALESIVVLGTGDPANRDCGLAYRTAATAMRMLADRKRKHVVIGFADGWDDTLARAAVAGAAAGIPGQDLYRAEIGLVEPRRVSWIGVSDTIVQAGTAVGEGICITKRLVNEPPNKIYPESFVEEAERLGRECGFEVESWDKDRLEAERCNAILAVSAGSDRPPRLAIFRYNGGPADEAPIAIVGKGVTFDSGGLSIKPSDGMKDMKCDMAGAATVLGTMVAVSRLKLAKNVVGLVGLAENMLSGSSYKLGDVIKTRNGTTIEILNTDAEGRVVLADTLDVAVQQEPSNIVDLATLTGACLVALGIDVAGVMTNDTAWCQQVKQAAELEDEKVWELPMWDFYGEQIKSKVADIKNVGEGRWGGAITAAKFLETFVGDIPWVHIDIAGPAYADAPKEWRDAGGTGAMVRTLIRLLEQAT
ncbi:Cytosol aminopeptidase [Rosistilla carotiformis]|uniref:Probable cytosol aminopeptidase n=1 Tax=Rosistilla carotiformis TaxID=2528017 RepID=A0A518K0A1_9BACT|nr:leucyl aminopeptidase [Rosistilla carotiformis]QDV71243.1 Cytosol aminopeptidase [Rosistilla carotiformis]